MKVPAAARFWQCQPAAAASAGRRASPGRPGRCRARPEARDRTAVVSAVAAAPAALEGLPPALSESRPGSRAAPLPPRAPSASSHSRPSPPAAPFRAQLPQFRGGGLSGVHA